MNALKSLWMGDVDHSMDESGIKSILSSLSIDSKINN
jgi:hypothetical protein